MTKFSFRLFHRRGPTDNLGELNRVIALRAGDPREAELEALGHLQVIDAKTQFAAVFDEEKSLYVKMWLDPDA